MNNTSSIAQELRAGKTVLVNTRGVSMRPLLWEGKTQVVVEPLRREIRIGDLPLVQVRPGLCRLHRVIRMEPGRIYTRGDNCVTTELVEPEAVLGVVTEIYRGRKQISMDGPGYRCYRWLWLHSFPIRSVLHRLQALVRRVVRGVVRRVKALL